MKVVTTVISSQKLPAIYMLLNRATGRYYVGQASNLAHRYYEHRKGKHGRRLKAAIAQYGWEQFDILIIESFSEELEVEVLKNALILRENHWISFWDATNPAVGYNILPKAGTSLGYRHTVESKIRMSSAVRNIDGDKNPNFGKRLSSEAKGRISKANTGRAAHNRKKIEQVDPVSGVVVKTWSSVAEASSAIGISITHIAAAARGHVRKHRNGHSYGTKRAGGYQWQYRTD